MNQIEILHILSDDKLIEPIFNALLSRHSPIIICFRISRLMIARTFLTMKPSREKHDFLASKPVLLRTIYLLIRLKYTTLQFASPMLSLGQELLSHLLSSSPHASTSSFFFASSATPIKQKQPRRW